MSSTLPRESAGDGAAPRPTEPSRAVELSAPHEALTREPTAPAEVSARVRTGFAQLAPGASGRRSHSQGGTSAVSSAPPSRPPLRLADTPGADERPGEAALERARRRIAAAPNTDAPAARPAEESGLLRAVGVVKSYRKGKIVVPVLKGVDFAVERGQFAAIVGQSGSGKSTLLHLLATLDSPDQGEIHFEGRRVDQLPAIERDRFRNQRLGMIFQFYHLLPELTALENVLAPLMIRHGAFTYWRRRREHHDWACSLMERVGLGHRLKHRPRELSGGEMQRAAIARALVTRPELLLADEPTGNLDTKTGREILSILRSLNEQEHLTIVMVTHDNAIADEADLAVRLHEGLVEQV